MPEIAPLSLPKARTLKNRLKNNTAATIAQCLLALASLVPLAAALPAHAQDGESLVDLINDYRADPGGCDGRRADPAAALVPHPALGRLPMAPGAHLQQALERAGYRADYAQAITISGPRDAYAAMDAIARTQCAVLLSAQFSSVGVRRSGDSWLVVLARPAPPSSQAPSARLPEARDSADFFLRAVNRARTIDRYCGERPFTAAPALKWSPALAEAARAHSQDMARQRYFSHQGKDGRQVADRAVRAGYRWRGIGDNIAAGQQSPEEAMAGWLASPGHCANIMDRSFTEMGAAHGVNSGGGGPHVYWTQVFGTPR
jgi:uncharacterized protein YkwD